MKTIAIVDDDITIGNLLTELLEKEGYRVIRAYSGTEALLLFENTHPDLVLLDLMLPGLSGEEVLKSLSGTPVIVVSAKIQIEDKVGLLLAGAADYVTKPFHTKELLARIAVQLRGAPSRPNDLLTAGELSLNTASHSVTFRKTPLKLTKTEFAILKLLMQNAGQVIAKSVILDRISEDTPDCTEYSLKQHISNLRKKLREVSGEDIIEAVWGIGFKLSLPEILTKS